MKTTYPPGGHVLITGTSTGIGRACAIHLAQLGFSVIAAVRDETAAHEIHSLGQSNHPLILDITDEASIAQAAEQVGSMVGPDGLRGLVNNAGICVAGPVEMVSPADWRRQFDVNVFGHIALTQAMLPLLRAHVRLHGRRSARIMMISSIAGRASQPLVGAYCGSKYALEAVSDALRNELKPEGIGVCIVEPGAFQTEIWRKAIEQMSELRDATGGPESQRYAKQVAGVLELTQRIARNARGADEVAGVVADCLIRAKPPIRTLVGRDARLVAAMKKWLPDRWFDSLLRWTMDRACRGMESKEPNENARDGSRRLADRQASGPVQSGMRPS